MVKITPDKFTQKLLTKIINKAPIIPEIILIIIAFFLPYISDKKVIKKLPKPTKKYKILYPNNNSDYLLPYKL